eukprot:Rhum_TRINITY_DN9704_c0_g2::Rhum_TRINITY_DN9704_c0_g2_i1::g.34761::m.34761
MGVGDPAMESRGGDASVPMVGFSLVARQGSSSPLLLFGGRNVDGDLLNGVWAVALTGEASLLPPAGLVPSPREFHTAHVLGGLMVSILGHVEGAGSADDDLPVFDTAREVWSAVPSVGTPPHFPRCHHTSCVDEETSTVFVLGGLPCDTGKASFHQLQLQASRGVWRAVESGTGVPRVWGHAAAVSGRGLYVSGGTRPEEGGEGKGEGDGEGTAGSFGLLRYDLDAGVWAEVAAGTAVATAGYDGAEAGGGKLSFETGDTLRVAERHSRGWSKGRVLARGGGGSASSSGWFPTSYVEEVCPDARALHVMVAASGEGGSDGGSQGDGGETALLAAASQAALLHKSIKIRDADVEQVMYVLEQISTQTQWCAVQAAYARDYPRAGGASLTVELAEVLDKRGVDKCRRILRQRDVHFDAASDSDGQLFLWGGECGRGAHTPVMLLADAWIFDEASKEWCRCEGGGGGGGGPAPEAQSGVSAVFVDGHVMIPFPHRSELFFFNPRTRLWSRRLFRFHSTRDSRRSTTPQTGALAVTPASSYATQPTHPPVLPVWVRPLDEVSSCSSASVMRLPGRGSHAAPLRRSPTLTPTPAPAPADVFTPLADAPAAPHAAAASLQAPPSLQAAGQHDAGTPACPRRQWSPPRARAGRDHTTLPAHSARYDVATATSPPPVSHAAAAATRRRPLPHAAEGVYGAAHAAPAA